MRPPAFWSRPPASPGWQARTLAPLAALYAAGTARRLRTSKGYSARVPVICVGNINVGGTGKTPTVIALADMLSRAGQTPHIVSRGYGGQLAGPVVVDAREHQAEDVGDEPLLLAAFAPTWVARNRAEGTRAAEVAGATVVLLDDGFQNGTVAKDYSIVVVDAGAGFGNGRVIPAGPLREPVPTGLKRANRVLSIGDPTSQAAFSDAWGGAITVPRTEAMLKPLETGMSWSGLRVFAFAGIGRPEKFFQTLRAIGADVVGTRALDDHQPLSTALITRMEREALDANARLVTTEKDMVRLPPALRAKVLPLPVRLTITADAGLSDAIRDLF